MEDWPYKELNEDDKKLVTELWAEVRAGDLRQTGMGLYLKMFTAHPEVIDMFSFVTTKDLVQLQKEPRFHKHVDNLMKSVGVAVDTLDNPEQMAKTLKALGKRHIKYNATIQQMAYVGEGLTYTVSQALGDNWTDERASAFANFYGVVGHHTAAGMV